MQQPILGIDFGTSNTSAAWVVASGELHVVSASSTERLVPSVIWFGPSGETVVGHAAREHLLDDPLNTCFAVKRLLGRPVRSEDVARVRERLPYRIRDDVGPRAAVEVRGRTLPITDLAGIIIRHVVELARSQSGLDFREVVLGVPAHFGYRRRQALRAAAALAGVSVRALINEPTAAALAYANRHSGGDTALVFDLGGGTFDATLLDLRAGGVRVMATGGDALLGGIEFDERLALHLAGLIGRDHGEDIKGQRDFMRRLTFAAEMAKIILSSDERTTIRIPHLTATGRHLDLSYLVTRGMLESATAPLVERAIGACDELVRRAGLTLKDVGEVILVGGPTRMPFLQRRLAECCGKPPRNTVHPELAVCEGAALLGHRLAGASPSLVDSVSVPVWVTIPGGRETQVLAANTAIPCATTLKVPLREGPGVLMFYEALRAASIDREVLGSVRLQPDWPRDDDGAVDLEVRMSSGPTLEVSLLLPDGRRQQLPLASIPTW